MARIRVQVVATPHLLQELLTANVAVDPELVIVEDVVDADVLVSTSGQGPLYVTRLLDTVRVTTPSELVSTIVAVGPA